MASENEGNLSSQSSSSSSAPDNIENEDMVSEDDDVKYGQSDYCYEPYCSDCSDEDSEQNESCEQDETPESTLDVRLHNTDWLVFQYN